MKKPRKKWENLGENNGIKKTMKKFTNGTNMGKNGNNFFLYSYMPYRNRFKGCT